MKKLLLVIMFLSLASYVFADGSMIQEPGNNLASGKTTVTVAGTAVALASTQTRILSVSIAWLPNNKSNKVYIGKSTVTASDGIQLSSGQILKLEINDLNKVYVNADYANDGVSWVEVQR